jgi:hypothetical protein
VNRPGNSPTQPPDPAGPARDGLPEGVPPAEPRVTSVSLKAGPQGGRRGDLSPGTSGYRQRRGAARKARTRRVLLRAGFVAAGVVLVVLLAFLAVRLVGGRGGGSQAKTAGGSSAQAPVLLVIREGDATKVAVVVDPASRRRLVLGLPATTLLEGPAGFEPLSAFLQRSDPASLLEAVDALISVKPAGRADLSWSELRSALKAIGEKEARPTALTDDQAGGEAAAKALAALSAAAGTDKGRQAIDKLAVLFGSPAAAKGALLALGRARVATGLPGRMVQGAGYTYYEPDLISARALVGAGAGGSATVEIQNGSGAVGITEDVAAKLKPLGYTLPPSRNADRFPNVAATLIETPPDSLGDAQRIRAALGIGRVVEKKDAAPRKVVVIVGKDLDRARLASPASGSTATGSTAATRTPTPAATGSTTSAP